MEDIRVRFLFFPWILWEPCKLVFLSPAEGRGRGGGVDWLVFSVPVCLGINK